MPTEILTTTYSYRYFNTNSVDNLVILVMKKFART